MGGDRCCRRQALRQALRQVLLEKGLQVPQLILQAGISFSSVLTIKPAQTRYAKKRS